MSAIPRSSSPLSGTILLFAAALFLLPCSGARAACPAAPTPVLSLPHSRAALAAGQELVIVALGSSSTESWMASDPAHSYPAVLQQTLEDGLARAHVAVLNRGIGGQDAREEVARLAADVLAVRPQLVIWQVGANGALRNTDPTRFETLVASGIARIEEAGADVVLMDNQQSPRILAAPEHAEINRVLANVAASGNAGLFSRSALMDAWRDEGAPYARFVASDGLHHNDLGYRCVAEALGKAILKGLEQDAKRTLATIGR